IYSDASGKPEKLLGVSEQLTFKHENTAGWYDLPFSSTVNLSAGNYWIGVITGPTNSVAGFRWTSVSNARDYNANTYSSGPTNPFGSVTTDGEQTSLYASYLAVPVNTAPPTITGTPKQGQTLTEVHGSWTNSPTSFSYQWLQCNGEGTLASCTPISGATKQEYVPVEGDVGHKLRVEETASNAGGAGKAATSEATAVVLPLPPSSTSPPTITGTPKQGQTLTEVHGSWTNSPTSYAYHSLQCNSSLPLAIPTPISGATKQEYVPVEG